jgi:hypothetical protein
MPTGATVAPGVDAENHQMARAQVLTDERSFRTDFAAIATALTGTISASNGSTTITGSGTLFCAEVTAGDYCISHPHARRYSSSVIGAPSASA